MDASAPTISILLSSAFNAALYLPEAIQSILDQTFEDFELLILTTAACVFHRVLICAL
jgi:hypothetical protein